MTVVDVRVDWFRVIVDLERAGMPHRKIGKAVHEERRVILRLKHGITGQPRYDLGSRLISLWLSKTGKTVDELPREP